jgi:hypothetical protein
MEDQLEMMCSESEGGEGEAKTAPDARLSSIERVGFLNPRENAL